jgi:5-hydroxyisourate hydrolase
MRNEGEAQSPMTVTDLYSKAAALTTHALDIAAGKPAAGLPVKLFKLMDGERRLVASATTNTNGRCDGPLLTQADVAIGAYALEFETQCYHGAASPFGLIPVEFNIADPDGHYHVPLVFAPGGYSTYRGAPPSRVPNDGGFWSVGERPVALSNTHSVPSTGGAGLSIHAIDTARGLGAGGMRGILRRRDDVGIENWTTVCTFEVNWEGRTDRWLIDDGRLAATEYELVFAAGDYYTAAGFGVGAVPFISHIRIRLRIDDPTSHHHIPLLLSPWGYSCYRGS